MQLIDYIKIKSFEKLLESYLDSKNIDYQEPSNISNYKRYKKITEFI